MSAGIHFLGVWVLRVGDPRETLTLASVRHLIIYAWGWERWRSARREGMCKLPLNGPLYSLTPGRPKQKGGHRLYTTSSGPCSQELPGVGVGALPMKPILLRTGPDV